MRKIKETIKALTRQSTPRKMLHSLTWSFGEKVIGALLAFTVSVWVIRYLGPFQYGVLTFAVSLSAILRSLGKMGMDAIVIRSLVQKRFQEGEILGSVFLAQLVWSIFIYIGLVSTLIFSGTEVRTTSIVAIVCLGILFRPGEVIDLWFHAQTSLKPGALARSLTTAISSILKLSLIFLSMPLSAFASLRPFESALSVGFLSWSSHRTGLRVWTWNFRWKVFGALFRDSVFVFLQSIAVVLYMRLDQIMLAKMVGAGGVGIYGAAVKISELVYFIPVSLSLVIFPSIVRSRENQTFEVHNRRLQLFFDLMAGAGYVITLPLAFIVPYFVPLLLGEEYANSADILRVHAWTFMFVCLAQARSKWLISENHVRFLFLAAFLGLLTNAGLNYWLIPIYGGVGAAAATLATQIVVAYLSLGLLKKYWRCMSFASRALLLPFRLKGVLQELQSLATPTKFSR